MPYPLSFTDVAMTAEFVFTTQGCLLSDPKVDEVVTRLHTFAAAVQLATFKFELDAGSVFDYRFDHKDGRRWRQKIDFAYNGPNDPGQSFDTKGDFWLLSEFEHHRPLRDALVVLHNWRAVTSIEVTFA